MFSSKYEYTHPILDDHPSLMSLWGYFMGISSMVMTYSISNISCFTLKKRIALKEMK